MKLHFNKNIFLSAETENSLFGFQKSDVVYTHDKFLDKIILKFLPKFVTPNILTMIRFLMTPIVMWCFVFEWYKIGVILFLIASFTDALDGSMARTQNKITDFGKLMDPLADKLLVGSAVIILVFRYLSFWLGVTILGIEIFFILVAIYFKWRFHTVRMANLWGKIKMISQVIAVCVTMFGLLLDFPFLFSVASWIFGIAIGFAILSLFTHGV